MDWKAVIKLNHETLTAIVAGLAAWLEMFEGKLRLPRTVYHSISNSLHKAEGAVRRLIIMAARGLTVPLPAKRPMPEGLIIARKSPSEATRHSFQLFDARVAYSFTEEEEPTANPVIGPRIHVFDDLSPRQQFLALFVRPRDSLCSAAEAKCLRLRVAAAARALANLTHEAKRMARWRARRAAMENPKFRSPLRPGPPPGINKRSKQEIDRVLRECHALAFEALRPDTS
jgi:hypothetical protein